jgi:murein DD-endopeptidase MepM/ murein hydrolase activator NlpD
MRKVLFGFVVVVAVILALVWLAGETPLVQLESPLKALGAATPVKVKVSDKNGVLYLRARVEQNGRSFPVFEKTVGGARWKFWRTRQPVAQVQFVAGRKVIPQLRDGPARLVLEAKSADWRGSAATVAADLAVRSTPPTLSADGAQHYINQGGSELVVFTAGPGARESGVRVGRYQFRSWPLPGGPPGSRFCLFAFPYDVPADTTPLVFVRDDAENEATATFFFRVFPKKFRGREIELTDSFMQKVEQNIEPHAPLMQFTGNLLTDYLQINGELRRENNRQLSDMRLKTEPHFLWNQPFRQLANSEVEAEFADHRRYVYKGQKVDEQDHLGFDLAVTMNTPVVAANDGKVIWAEYLGIYGNCIVIDHGYGLQSIYGHLNSFGVKAGDMVRQGQEIARSDSTGLAGGDHMHFSMQVDGVEVTPTEWWDSHWIRDRILKKFPGEKLPAGSASAPAAAGHAPAASD